MTPIDQSVGPGLAGFIATFFLAVALWLIARSMTKHLRKVRHDAAAASTMSGVVDGDAGGDVVADKANNR